MAVGRAVILFIALASCAEPPTQVVVRLATDIPSTELSSLTLRVDSIGPDGARETRREQSLVDLDIPPDGRYHEIGTFGVVPFGGDPTRRFEVEVAVRGPDGPLFETRAITGFVRRRTIRLDVYVTHDCIEAARDCRPEETCGVLGCVDPEIDPEVLEVQDPDEPAPDPDGDDARGSGAMPDVRPLRPLHGALDVPPSPSFLVAGQRGVTRITVEVCREAGCPAGSREGLVVVPTGDGRLPAAWTAPPLTVGRHFWRLEACFDADRCATSPTWWFEVRGGAGDGCRHAFDANGDGRADLLVGAPGEGAAYLYRDIAGPGPPLRVSDPAASPGFADRVDGGDLDGLGTSDLIIASPEQRRVYVYLRGEQEADLDAADVVIGGTWVDRFGAVLAFVGDVDGDGYGDIAIGDPAAGAVRLHLGGRRGPATDPVIVPIPEYGDAILTGIAAAGDLDGDLRDDLVVLLYRLDVAARRFVVMHGHPEGLRPGASVTADGIKAAAAAGDADGDGDCDLAVGMPDFGPGAVAIVLGDGEGGLGPATPLIVEHEGASAGEAVAMLDVDRDGATEGLTTLNFDKPDPVPHSHVGVVHADGTVDGQDIGGATLVFLGPIVAVGRVDDSADEVVAASLVDGSVLLFRTPFDPDVPLGHDSVRVGVTGFGASLR